MQVIVSALESGKERFSPAFFTVTRVIELLHTSSPECLSPTEFYEEMLREIKEEEDEQ
jgi:hypothetical protein